MPPIPQIGVAEISDIIVGVIVGLVIGGFWSIVSWYKRRKELGAKLYYPLWLACCNLLLLFDEIDNYETDEARGRELFNSAVQPLNDIMYNYGTAVHLKGACKSRLSIMCLLKGKLKKPEEDYLGIFFRAKRIIDLNQTTVKSNWAQAVRCFKNAKERIFSGDNKSVINKIEEFESLYNDLQTLKEFCESKDKNLKGVRI